MLLQVKGLGRKYFHVEPIVFCVCSLEDGSGAVAVLHSRAVPGDETSEQDGQGQDHVAAPPGQAETDYDHGQGRRTQAILKARV